MRHILKFLIGLLVSGLIVGILISPVYLLDQKIGLVEEDIHITWQIGAYIALTIIFVIFLFAALSFIFYIYMFGEIIYEGVKKGMRK
jgi:hypothetical protein